MVVPHDRAWHESPLTLKAVTSIARIIIQEARRIKPHFIWFMGEIKNKL